MLKLRDDAAVICGVSNFLREKIKCTNDEAQSSHWTIEAGDHKDIATAFGMILQFVYMVEKL